MADVELIIKIPEELYQMCRSCLGDADSIESAIANGTPLPKGHGRKFEEVVVEYPPADLCTYPEYRGKPYFSIKYEENGEHIIGFGTYNPEVFSKYLQEYFIIPTIIEANKENEDDLENTYNP